MTYNQTNDTLSLHETLDFIGNHLFAGEWQKDDWQAYFWPLDTSDLGFCDQKPDKNDDCIQTGRVGQRGQAQQVMSRFFRFIRSGILKPYCVNGILREYISLDLWEGSIGKGILQSGIYKIYQSDGEQNISPVIIDRENLNNCLADIPKRSSQNVGGRPEKFNYGKLTAIAWAILEDDNLIERSSTLSLLILDVYKALFPKDDLPSVDSLEKKITREWRIYKQAAQSVYRKINKERGLETAE